MSGRLAAAAAECIDELVARNRIEPRQHWRLPTMALQVDRKQGLLHNVIRIDPPCTTLRRAKPRTRQAACRRKSAYAFSSPAIAAPRSRASSTSWPLFKPAPFQIRQRTVLCYGTGMNASNPCRDRITICCGRARCNTSARRIELGQRAKERRADKSKGDDSMPTKSTLSAAILAGAVATAIASLASAAPLTDAQVKAAMEQAW